MEVLPLGFQAGEDIARGSVYVDESGNQITADELTARLKKMRGKLKIARAGVQFWMPGDAKDKPPRRRVVNVPVSGDLSAEDAGRAVHEAVRRLYDSIRKRTEEHHGEGEE